jgi:hypothetical protein
MSLIIDRKFVSVVSTKLEKFRQKKDLLWNFRCVFCGDSKKNKTKARAYFYLPKKHSNLSFICHNCGSGMSLGSFLKNFDNNLFRQYQMERYKEESHGNTSKPDFSLFMEQPTFSIKSALSIPSIESLGEGHSAKNYIASRKIPKEKWSELYYANDFKQFCDETFPNHGKNLIKEEPRIVIPFYNKNSELIGIQGRSMLVKSKLRYITIKANDNVEKIYGLNRLDFSRTIYVVEGPIDSMFLPNSIATMDASLYSVIQSLGEHDYIFVFDNEPRNKEVCKHMSKAIKLGQKVCIWPSDIREKDVNDMVLTGHDVLSIIQSNTYKDLTAELKFQTWKKCEV